MIFSAAFHHHWLASVDWSLVIYSFYNMLNDLRWWCCMELNKHGCFHHVQHCCTVLLIFDGITTKRQIFWSFTVFVSYYGGVFPPFHKKHSWHFYTTNISVLITFIFLCQLLTSVDWSVVCPLRADLAQGWVFETISKCYINYDGFELNSTLAQSVL